MEWMLLVLQTMYLTLRAGGVDRRSLLDYLRDESVL